MSDHENDKKFELTCGRKSSRENKRENVCEPACASARMGLVKCQRECQAPPPGRDEQSGGGTGRGLCKASWSVPTSKLATASSIVPSSEGWSAAAAFQPVVIEASDGIGARASIESCDKAICVRAKRGVATTGPASPRPEVQSAIRCSGQVNR